MQEIETNRELKIVLSHFDLDRRHIRIHHFYKSTEPDQGRIAFTLYALTRSRDIVEPKILDAVREMIHDLENKLKKDFEEKNITTLCYLIRAKKNLNISVVENIEFLTRRDLSSVYTHPVSMYVFVSMIHEVGIVKESYLYSIRNECIKVLEYLLLTDSVWSQPIFALAEVNYWQDNLSDSTSFLDKTNRYLLAILENEDLKSHSSSGLAKCAEFVSLAPNATHILNRILQELEMRKLKHGNGIRFKDDFRNEFMHVENYNNAHVCLDTNTHLLLTYLNLSESKESKR